MRVNTGIDIEANQLGNPANTGSASYMALSSNATAPSATDTTMAGEYATAGGGLIVKQVTGYAHTAGVASYAVSATFTANATDGSSNVVNKFCLRTASAATATNMMFETAMPSPPTLVPGDSVAVTDTVAI